jgi:hypothetical protein
MGKNKKGNKKDTNQTSEINKKEEEDRDAILKELHDDESKSSESSEDEDLNIANLKKQMISK